MEFRGIVIALNVTTFFSRLLARYITMVFFTYAFVDMGVVTGILPVVSVSMLFIIYLDAAAVTLGVNILMPISPARPLAQT